jgi:two-component system sensor kinase FixL
MVDIAMRASVMRASVYNYGVESSSGSTRPDLIEQIASANRGEVLTACLLLAALIALCDWFLRPPISVGIFYIVPMAISAVFLRRWQILLAAMAATALQEQFGPAPWEPDAAKIALEFMAFAGLSLFVGEVVRSRRIHAEDVKKFHEESALRHTAEEDARALIESGPAAVIAVGPDGRILMTNNAAKRLLGLGSEQAVGQNIGDYLPVLGDLMNSKRTISLAGTMVEGNGRRCNGEVFFAQMWLSSYQTGAGTRLAVVVTDASEQLRDREEIGLRQLLMNSRIVAAAVSHEIRNMAAAASALLGSIGKSHNIAFTEDFEALRDLLKTMQKLSSAELPASAEQVLTGVDINALLRELKIIISSKSDDVELSWEVAGNLPRVRADHSGLLQVMLNLTQNSLRALNRHPNARISVSAYQLDDSVVVRVSDNGSGVAAPEVLFQPFQAGATSSGLGLYVSRAIVRTYGGDLHYTRHANNGYFLIELPAATMDLSAHA